MDLPTSSTPLLSVRNLAKTYHRRGKLTGERTALQALRGVDLELPARRTLAVVGPSGAGKSTLARCLAGLEPADSGEVFLDGHQTSLATIHRRIQMIFQDPAASLNSRFTIVDALAEPLTIRNIPPSRSGLADRLDQVGLPQSAVSRLTSELSGGQKARLALARALAALDDDGRPCVLILDESLAGLDLSVQAQMINLLMDLQQQRGLSYILIAHDINLAAHLSDELAVLWEGRIVERGAPQSLLQNPAHPQWRQLVAATMALEKSDARDA